MLALAQQVRTAQDDSGALSGRDVLPGREGFGGGLDGLVSQFDGGLGEAAHYLVGVGRVYRDQRVVQVDVFAADDQGVGLTQLRLDRGEGGGHCLAAGGIVVVNEWLVAEGRNSQIRHA